MPREPASKAGTSNPVIIDQRRTAVPIRRATWDFSVLLKQDFPQQEVVAMPRAARAGVDSAARLILLSTITSTIRF